MANWRPNWARGERLPENVVFTAEPPRALNLTRMEPAAKRQTWSHIQANNPALAELLADPTFRALRDAFDGDVLIDPEEAPGGLD